MSEIKTGGQAFPRALPTGEFPPDECLRIIQDHAGMTLRDYFAAKAMNSELIRMRKDFDNGETEFTDWEDAQGCAAMLAYSMADAMLKARNGA